MRLTAASFRDRLLPIALSQGVGLVCGVVGVKFVSRLVPPADYGVYGVFISFTPLGMWVVHAGLLKFVARHWAESRDRRGLLGEVLRAGARKIPWLAVATLGAVFTFFPERWALGGGLLFAAALMLSLLMLVQTALQAARAHWRDLGVSSFASIARTALPPLFYVFAGGTAPLLMGGFALYAFLAASVAWLFLRHHIHTSAPEAPANQTTSPQLSAVYDGPLFVGLAIAGWMLTAVNRWIVAGFFGAEAAGFFTLASTLTLIVTAMIGVIFLQYFQPALFALPYATTRERQALARRVDQLALAYTSVALAGVLVLHGGTPWLIGPFIAESYRPMLGYVAGAGCFGVATTAAQFFSVMLLATRRETGCGPIELSAAALLIGGGVLSAAVGGETWFLRWLLVTPLTPWVLNRALARRYLR
jgi:O-antigen/teichoic acid export membrane protein